MIEGSCAVQEDKVVVYVRKSISMKRDSSLKRETGQMVKGISNLRKNKRNTRVIRESGWEKKKKGKKWNVFFLIYLLTLLINRENVEEGMKWK